MKTYSNKYFSTAGTAIMAMILLAVASVSCTREDDRLSSAGQQREISFTLAAGGSSQAATKVKPYNSTTKFDGSKDSFGVTAFSYSSSNAAVSDWSLFSSPLEVKYNSTLGTWFPSSKLYYPGSGYLRFFSYAPFKDGDGNEVVVSTSGSGGIQKPTVSLTVNPDVSKQIDLLVATPGELSGNPSVDELTIPLVFRHALAGVCFKAEAGLEVEQIKISGIYDSGVLDMETTSWDPLSLTKKGNIYVIDNPIGAVKDGYIEYDEELTMMMIPQKLPAGAKIEVKLAGVETPISTNLENLVWGRGKLVSYIITNTEISSRFYYLGDPSLTLFNVRFDKLNNTTTGIFSIRSFWTDGLEKNWAPITFTYSMSEDGPWYEYSDIPEDDPLANMISRTVNPVAMGHSEISAQVHLNILPNSVVEGFDVRSENKRKMKNRPELSATDLSMWDAAYGTQSMGVFGRARTAPVTANCYIVRQRGTYRFPIVYGNGIDAAKNPEAPYYNEPAYKDNVAIKNFSNYAINLPFLHQDPYVNPSGEVSVFMSEHEAIMVWEDMFESANFITDIGLVEAEMEGNGTVPYISFKVDDNIQEGNIVLAVRRKSDNVIVWSWHIWVCGEDDFTPVELTNGDAVVTRVMPIVLGWNMEKDSGNYPERTLYVKVTQNATQNFKIIKVVQAGSEGEKPPVFIGNGTYYQFGRKDPMLPNRSSAGADGFLYSGYNKNFWSPLSLLSTSYLGTQNTLPTISGLVNTIQNPWAFALGTSIAGNTSWNSAATESAKDEAVVKTVYDPCPPGFCVPRRNFIYLYDYAVEEKSSVILAGSRADGYVKIKKSVSDTEGFKIPLYGRRNGTGTVSSLGDLSNLGGSMGHFWTATYKNSIIISTANTIVKIGNDNVFNGKGIIPAVED